MSKAGRRLGYIRTSTAEQCPDRQIEGLRHACDEVFIEQGVSACAESRPIYEEVIAKLQPGDTLVVWDVDRAYRSVIDALTEVGSLNARGIAFKAVGKDYDLTTPEGEFVLTMEAALGAYERKKLSMRTKEGLAAARARGVRLGRPRKLTGEQVESAKELIHKDTYTLKIIAKSLGVTSRTLRRALVIPKTIVRTK